MTVSPSDAHPPLDSSGDPSGAPRPSRGRGFLFGGVLSGAFLVTVLVNPDTWRDPYAEADSSRVGVILWLSALAIPVGGYTVAIVMTSRRSTTRIGQGMLMGLTILLPVAFAVLFGIGMSRSV